PFGSTATPDGGSPAVVHMTSHQAATWAARSSPVGDQEARSSSSVVDGSSRLSPKLSDTARVIVPDRPAYPAGSSASSSQSHATEPISSSAATSGSRSARMSDTTRKPLAQPPRPAGAYRTL